MVREKFEALAAEIETATGDRRSPVEVADGFLKIAVDNMANAIKQISVQRGYDVTDYTLNSFGGAGGQHACLVADALGMTRVFVHPFAGVLSAYGMGLAEQRIIRERAVEKTLDDALVDDLNAAVRRSVRRRCPGNGIPGGRGIGNIGDCQGASPLRGHRYGAGRGFRIKSGDA